MGGFDRWYQAVSRSGSAYRRLLDATCCEGQFVGQQGFSGRDELLRLAAAVVQDRPGPLLDVCCGAGGPAACIATQLGAKVVGLDTSLAGLRLAHVPVVAGDAVSLPFGPHTFGAALVLDSLASISAPDRLFCELARVVQPGGGLGLTAEIGPPLTAAETACFTRSAPPTVLEEHAVRALLEAAGFVEVDVCDYTASAAGVAQRLASGLATQHADLAQELGEDAALDLRATLSCLADLLASRRIADKAIVARRRSP
jgi:SAM-dependent methyltransferase